MSAACGAEKCQSLLSRQLGAGGSSRLLRGWSRCTDPRGPVTHGHCSVLEGAEAEGRVLRVGEEPAPRPPRPPGSLRWGGGHRTVRHVRLPNPNGISRDAVRDTEK